jgi:hypothetical protein
MTFAEFAAAIGFTGGIAGWTSLAIQIVARCEARRAARREVRYQRGGRVFRVEKFSPEFTASARPGKSPPAGGARP